MFHLLTHLYASIAFALSENKRLLADTSPEFRIICLSLKTGSLSCSVKNQVKHINFTMKRAAYLVHHAKFQYNINKMMRQDIVGNRECPSVSSRPVVSYSVVPTSLPEGILGEP